MRVFLFLFMATFASCGLLDKLLTFTINDSYTFTIPPASVIAGPIPVLMDQEVDTEFSQELENENTNLSLVKTIKVKSIIASIQSPPTQTFSPLNKIEVFIQAGNLPELLVASKYNIPSNVGQQIELDTSNESLKDYIENENITIKVATTVDETTVTPTDVKLDIVYDIRATLLQ